MEAEKGTAWSLLEFGAWSLELGAWSLELGAWSLELGVWSLELAVVTPACKLPVFLLHYVIAEKGVGHAIYGEEGRTVCRGIVQG